MSNTARFTDADHRGVEAVIDGKTRLFSAKPGNRHYDLIVNGRPANTELGFPALSPTPIADWVAPPITVNDVSEEAERRIELGTTIRGITFRTDDATMIRMRGLLDAFEIGDVPSGGVTYSTASGTDIVFPDAATALLVYRAANLFRSAVLEASQTLQRAIPADYSDDSHWPAGAV